MDQLVIAHWEKEMIDRTGSLFGYEQKGYTRRALLFTFNFSPFFYDPVNFLGNSKICHARARGICVI